MVSKESKKSPTRGLYRLDGPPENDLTTVGVINLYRPPADGLSSNHYIYGGAVSAFQIWPRLMTMFFTFEAVAFSLDITLTLTTALIEAIHFTAVDPTIKLLTVIRCY